MARFGIKFMILLGGLWLLLNGLGAVSNRIAPLSVWYSRAEADYENLIRRRDQVHAVSIGNSHAEAIDFSVPGLQGQTMARAGADLFEVERYMASVAARLPSLETVFIALPYYAMSRDNSVLSEMQILRVELYTLLPTWRAISGDEGNFALGKVHRFSKLMYVVRPDHWHDVILNERGLRTLWPEPSPTGAASDGPDEKPCPSMSPSDQEAHARTVAGKNITSSREMVRLHPGLEADARAALARTIEQLQARGVRVVLFTPPYYQAYSQHFLESGSDLAEQTFRAVAELQDRYQVQYVNDALAPELSSRAELFVNSDHTNACGSRIFTDRLLRSIQIRISDADER